MNLTKLTTKQIVKMLKDSGYNADWVSKAEFSHAITNSVTYRVQNESGTVKAPVYLYLSNGHIRAHFNQEKLHENLA